MCGICGIINSDNSNMVDKNELVTMRDMMIHRGPDESGIYVQGNVGLGHRRLSIVDISKGRQPISNEEGTIWCVFNGEIYNFKLIRDELLKSGHCFATSCDTEVLVHLYEEYKTEFVHKLQGMFSFALWDSKNKILFAARDRLGIKPFYYMLVKGKFIFASEIKSILCCEGVYRDVNKEYIAEYLIFRYVSGENSLFKGVKALLPGHTLLWDGKNIKTNQYWSAHGNYISLTHNQAEEKLHCLMETSVQRRLMSDVPLGTLNSGGIDSSLVTAYAAEMKADPINTYSVGFEESEYDESYYASIVSKQFHTNHHPLVVNRKEFACALPLALWYNEEPLNHANSVMLLLICKLAKQRVTVLLTGEGADEIFGGYPRYWILFLQERLPMLIRRALAFSVSLLPGHYPSKLSQFMPMSNEESLLLNSSFVLPDLVRGIFNKPINNISFPYRSSDIQQRAGGENSLVDRGLNLDLSTYLVSILHRMDRMSMATSVEARVPFLDHEVVEFGMALPYNWKLSLLEMRTKSILKKVASKKLPDQIVCRKKSGFGVPVGPWLRDNNALGPFLDMLSEKKFRERDIFRPEIINHMITAHRNQTGDYSEILWELINLELWFRLFIDQLSSKEVAMNFANNLT